MRKFIILLILSAFCIPLNAETLYGPVSLRLNSIDGIYTKGAPVYVYAEISEDSSKDLRYTVKTNGSITEQRILHLNPGVNVILDASYDKAASVIVSLGTPDGSAETSVGFLVAPEDFKPGFQRPADLDDFWKKQIDVMRSLPLTFKTRPATDVREDVAKRFECYHVEIPMPEGNPVRAYVAYPKDAPKHSLPIYIIAHSAGVNRTANKSMSSLAISRAREGAIVIDINAHGYLNDQPQEYYDALNNGELHRYFARPVTDHESYYFRLMYLRLVRALDYMVTLPEWDGKRVMIWGESQGGGQALALGGIDSRVTHVCAIVPALTDTGGCLDGGRKCGWPSDANIKAVQKENGKDVLPYYDGAVLISNFKGRLYIEAGNVDLTCDPACVSAGFNNATTPAKEIHFFPWRPHHNPDKRYSQQWNRDVLYYRNLFFKNFYNE